MIIDADGNEITSLSMSGPAGSNITFSLLIDCQADYSLSAVSPDAGIVIWGKAEPGDAFQNLQTTPIVLTPYFPGRKTFYFECRIDAGEPNETLIYQIIVKK